MPLKINKGQLAKKASPIRPSDSVHQGLVTFSFKYLELANNKFDLPCTVAKHTYLGMLFDRLKHISGMKCHEFRLAGKVLRSHRIDWGDTSEPNGFSQLPEHLQDCQPWQFSLARDELGRIHGFWVGDTFYAVWVDHEHVLYS